MFSCASGIGTPRSSSSCLDAVKSNQTGVRRHEAHALNAAKEFTIFSPQTIILTPTPAGTTQQFSCFRIPHELLPSAVIIFRRHFRLISGKGFFFLKRWTPSVRLSNPDPLHRHPARSAQSLPNINRRTSAPPVALNKLPSRRAELRWPIREPGGPA